MGNAYYLLQEHRRAIDCFKKALVYDPDNLDYHFNIANTLVEIKEFTEAIRHYKKILELDSDVSYANTEQALMMLAKVYEEELQDVIRAKKVYKKIVDLFPRNKTARGKLKRNLEDAN